MKNNFANGTRLILLHPYIQKQGTSSRLWLLALASLLTLASVLTLMVYNCESISTTTRTTATTTLAAASPTRAINPPLPSVVTRALIHYASITNATDRMFYEDIKQVADVLRQCSPSCNMLVFGLPHEILLWRALNANGRTVYIDENRYYAAYIEEKYPGVEAYDVQYTTKLRDMPQLVAQVKEQVKNECRPVQNLLFSECRLGLNDLPNQLYELDWDIILVDGPRGYWPDAPGRMSTIFTAGVLARSKKGGSPKTHVFVHDFNNKVDRVTSFEFLCKENLVKAKDLMAHFVLERMSSETLEFCQKRPSDKSWS